VYQKKFVQLLSSTSEANIEFKSSLLLTMIEDTVNVWPHRMLLPVTRQGDFSDLAAACVPELMVPLEALLQDDAKLIVETIVKTIAQEEADAFQETIGAVEMGTLPFHFD
jgi:hypothetical protein